MKNQSNILFMLILGVTISQAQIPDGVLHRQTSKMSRFEFSVFNSGLLYGDYGELSIQVTDIPRGFAPSIAAWPRGYDQMGAQYAYFSNINGMAFLAKKGNEYFFREATSIGNTKYDFDLSHGPFYGMVPGRIGDLNAGFDDQFNGIGWKYHDDRDYIAYSSVNYDSNGIDISGNNYNDWPIRYVNGKEQYVHNYLERPQYKPVFKSDEDFFTVYKDTDPRSYRNYQKKTPLGIEVQQYIYSWGSKGLRDVILFRYDYINKGADKLDSCYFIWDHGVQYSMEPVLPIFFRVYYYTITQYLSDKDIIYQQTIDTTYKEDVASIWRGTNHPPVVATSIIKTPEQYDGSNGKSINGGPVGRFTLQHFDQVTAIGYGATNVFNDTVVSEEIIYRRLLQNKFIHSKQGETDLRQTPVLISSPFKLLPGDTARFVASLMFMDSPEQILRMNEIIKKVYESGFKTPSPPDPPIVKAKALNRGIYLEWDKSAEASIDPIIPDSISKSFAGYRVYRASNKNGPYTVLKEWRGDTLAHDYFDKGADIGGLKNNVTYYYKVVSFDAPDTVIGLESMESPAVAGKNFIEITPSTASSNYSSPSTDGDQSGGTFGDFGSMTVAPTNVTNYRTFFEGRNLQIKLSSVTNGVKYLFPVTIKDTLSGRVQNEIVDIGLNVHGSADTKGIKKGAAVVKDIFGLSGANLELKYSFEQLADSFKVVGTIQSTNGADVPVITKDSLNYTGITEFTPFTNGSKNLSIRFTIGGIDTFSTLFKRAVPYLNVDVYDEATGTKMDTGFTFTAYGIRAGVSLSYTGKANRYYLSGLLANGETWEFGHVFRHYNSRIVLDFSDRGAGSGKTGTSLFWGSVHRSGTKDFIAGDRVNVTWSGGVKATFPKDAIVNLTNKNSMFSSVTNEMLDKIRIVPNPYLVRHEAQRGTPELYFNYLPVECTIKIYTIALDLVKTIYHNGGSRSTWNLQTEGGQQVASQMLYAYVESPNGAKTIKKFSVIAGK